MVVAPEAQGRGIGKALAREITQEADARGMQCYLESSRDVPNVQIYEKMGFRLVRDMKCDDDGAICMLYCMVRDPVDPGSQ
jgi:GNAT superfamily N-acetyltransferase